jgi:hypothetical protein
MRRAEKRAHIEGTTLSDFPSGRDEPFNFHSGKNDYDACSETDCRCLMFISAI